VFDPTNEGKQHYFNAVIDTGCDGGDMVTPEVVSSLGYTSKVQICYKVIGICLNGHELRSTGTVSLKWHVIGSYKFVESRFHIVEGDSLPWQIVLGANTCNKYELFTVAAFGKRQIPQHKSESN
jgi:hypothetical protein